MTNETKRQSPAALHCWSCNTEIAPTDNFCRNCGAQLKSTSTKGSIHARLTSIEKKLTLRTILELGALLLLAGWIALQLHHFGRD